MVVPHLISLTSRPSKTVPARTITWLGDLGFPSSRPEDGSFEHTTPSASRLDSEATACWISPGSGGMVGPWRRGPELLAPETWGPKT